MSRIEKAKERIKQKPRDYTYKEATYLLEQMGYKEHNKGKTSGSRVMFYREYDQQIVRRHIVGGTYRTLISVQNPLRLCRTGICRSLSAG